MIFSSWEYLLFITVLVLVYFSIPQKWRIGLLLIGSYYFYMSWKWQYGFLTLFTTAVNFYCGRRIGQADDQRERKIWLALAFVLSLSTLVYFKYTNFFIGAFADMAAAMGWHVAPPVLDILLPAGISFFTFHALSYPIDLYRGRVPEEKSLLNFATYVAFFPLMLAGPIERSTNLLQQFKQTHHFDSTRLIEGGKLFVWGLFKKVVIADRLAIYVDQVYSSPASHNGTTLAIATLFFAFQIYCDFSGYTDMAIGTGRIMGFRLLQNFNLPYLADSISDFWRRWHISLSSWFGDYLYRPLGGNRVGVPRWIVNICVVFLVSGFWHGAKWTFIIWGGLFAIYYLLEHIGDKLIKACALDAYRQNRVYKIFKIIIVFAMVDFAWIFFRAANVGDALLICKKIFTDLQPTFYQGAHAVTTALSAALIVLLCVVQVCQYKGWASIHFAPSRAPVPLQWAAYVLMLLAIAMFGIDANAFIYFQF